MILVIKDNDQTTVHNTSNPDDHDETDNTTETQLGSVYIDELSKSLPDEYKGNGFSERRNAIHVKCPVDLPPRPSSVHSVDLSTGKHPLGIKKKLRNFFHKKDGRSSTKHMEQYSTSFDAGELYSTSFEADLEETEYDEVLDRGRSRGNSRSSTPEKFDGHSINMEVVDDFVIRSDSMSSTSTTGSQTPKRKGHHHLTSKFMHKIHDKALEVLSKLGVASEETLESSVTTERVTEAGIREETDRAREIIEAFTERGHVTASTEPEEMELAGITHILPSYETYEIPDFENDFVGVYDSVHLHTAEIQCSSPTLFNPFANMFVKNVRGENDRAISGTTAEIHCADDRNLEEKSTRSKDDYGKNDVIGNSHSILVQPVDSLESSSPNDVQNSPMGKLDTLGENPYRFLPVRKDR